MTKIGITIGLLITFLISLTASELHAWHMIRKGDQSTVTLPYAAHANTVSLYLLYATSG